MLAIFLLVRPYVSFPTRASSSAFSTPELGLAISLGQSLDLMSQCLAPGMMLRAAAAISSALGPLRSPPPPPARRPRPHFEPLEQLHAPQ